MVHGVVCRPACGGGVEQGNRYVDVLMVTYADLEQSPKAAPACE
jgi:hypothetical protein